METGNESKVFIKKMVGQNERVFSGGFSREQVSESESSKEPSKKVIKFFDFVIRLSMLAIFLGIPLFFTNLSFQGVSFEKQMYFYFWTLVALITWASKCGYAGEMKIRKTPLDIPIVVFWLAYLAATIFSVDKWHSFFGFFGDPSRGFINITALVVIYYLILNNFNMQLFKWIFKGIVISGSVIVIWSFLGILGIKIMPAAWMAYFPLSFPGSIESLGIFLSAFVPILIVSVFKMQENKEIPKIKRNAFSALQLVILLFDLFLIFSLYAYIEWPAILIGLVIFLVFILSKIIRPKEAWAVVPMVSFVLVLVFLMIGQMNISRTPLPLSVNVPYATSMKIAKDGLKSDFFLGSGAANYGYVFSKNLPAGFDNMGIRFFQGQGIILEAIATIGVIGTIALFTLLLTFLGVILFMLSRDKEKNKVYSLGIVAAAIIMLVNILMTRSEASVLIYGVLMGSLALATLYLEGQNKQDFFVFSLKASPKFALTLAFIYLLIFASVAFLFVFFGKIYVADVKMRSASLRERASEEGSITKIAQAINVNPREGKYFTLLGQEYMALTNDEMLKDEKERSLDKIQAYMTLAIQASKRGEELMKNDVSTVEAEAQIYDNAGLYVGDALKLAEETYNRAKDLEPNNPALYVKIGQIKLRMVGTEKDETKKKEMVEEAKDLFQKAVDLRAGYSVAHYNLALANEALGDMDKAIESMTNATLLERGNINYFFNLARMFQARGKGDDLKTAEGLYKQILGVNDKEINTHFNLALLYEKDNKKGEAVDELKKVLELLPEGSTDAKTQLEKMVSNIQNGVPNTAENLGLTAPKQEEAPTQEEQPQEQPQPQQ